MSSLHTPLEFTLTTSEKYFHERKFLSEEVTGFKVPEDKSVLVRDFVIDKGMEFGEIKDKFAE